MIRFALLVGVAIVGTTAIVPAQTFFGAGTVSCGDWLKYRDQNLKGQEYQAQAWIDSGSGVGSR
jgi:hypothetical protein